MTLSVLPWCYNAVCTIAERERERGQKGEGSCGRGSEELQIVSCAKMREMIARKEGWGGGLTFAVWQCKPPAPAKETGRVKREKNGRTDRRTKRKDSVTLGFSHSQCRCLLSCLCCHCNAPVATDGSYLADGFSRSWNQDAFLSWIYINSFYFSLGLLLFKTIIKQRLWV